ncbi:MAG: nucleotidyltransferase domain-containing protein [Acidobacteriia bacterium]|nr:nucleotidyltransferase domain-containing protein [Terriglobia bacterium]
MLEKARLNATKAQHDLDGLLAESIGRYNSEDTSLVVFGSLAREEWTSGSDLDWTYLIDGQANSDHLRISQEIGAVLKKHGDRFRSPGQTGTFGNLAFSHELVHQIGGHTDSNKNTTQRVLLLLESAAIGASTQAYDRVLKAVINRYLEEDNHVLTEDRKSYRVPRFLLNDIVRFWRTMAVDFASKQRDRAGEGWGLRNTKLRMSRKLILASGLLVCFGCTLDSELQSRISTDKSDIRLDLVNHIRDRVRLTPLQMLNKSLRAYEVPDTVQSDFFTSYADFIALLDDSACREKLQALRASDSRTDPTFKRVKEISAVFEKSLDYIFFESPQLKPLTRKYGVF